VPIISNVPGFVEYVGVQVGEDEGLTISFFETQEQAEESTRRAAEWVKDYLAPLAAGPHEIVAVGEVRFRKTKQAQGEAALSEPCVSFFCQLPSSLPVLYIHHI